MKFSSARNLAPVSAIGAALLVVGCAAYTPRADQMVPARVIDRVSSVRPTIRLHPVTGGESPRLSDNAFDGVKLDARSFQEALGSALRGSGIFDRVIFSGAAPLELYAQILGQQSRFGSEFGSMTVTLLVAYRLVDTEAGRVVWKENLLSQATADRGSGPSEVAIENMRTMMAAYERTAQDNLRQLLQALVATPGMIESDTDD